MFRKTGVGLMIWYDVTYFTTDKAQVEIKYNPVSGEPQ